MWGVEPWRSRTIIPSPSANRPTHVPKTLIFAKDDSHAEDIVELVRQEFGKGDDFCQKITYKTTGRSPKDLIQAVIFLQGGGGTREAVASQLSIVPPASPAPDSAWLMSRSVAFVFPQGQAEPSAPRAMTWSNYVMDSGVDDMAFLAALQAALRSGTLLPGLAKVRRVYRAGHSNGGMMANLYLGLIGVADAVLQTIGNWSQQYWAVNPALCATPGFVGANLVNEEFFHRRIRGPLYCSGAVANPTLSADAKRTSWSDCGGRVRLVRAETADHWLAPTPICSASLPEHSGCPCAICWSTSSPRRRTSNRRSATD